MSYDLIQQALELRLHLLAPNLPTAWANVAFTPPNSLYQRAFILQATTNNPSFGDTLARESGIFQVSICSPLGIGTADGWARAKLIRDWFPRGLSMQMGGLIVRILNTPSIAPAIKEEIAYVSPVSISYMCDVY